MRSACCATLACLCTLLAGCYEWVRVPPGELAKLDRADPPPLRESSQARADYWAEPHDADEPPPAHRLGPDVLRTDDGGMFDADVAKAVRIVTDRPHDFRRPLTCVVTPEQISIGPGHDQPIAFETEDVRATEVHVYRRGLSRALWTFGFVIGAFTTYFVGMRLLEHIEGTPMRSNPSP